jgi:hypothetical protein
MTRIDVVGLDVEHDRRRTALEQETGVAEVEEDQARWVEARDETQPEHISVELDRSIEIDRSL